jgi:hypothetical protein
VKSRHRAARAGLGAALIAVFWWIEWHAGAVVRGAAVSFFLLWLGYIVVVDAFVGLRTGSSMLERNPVRWLGLFALSAPVWWLFEALNRFLHNWEYLGTAAYSRVEYDLLATLSFSVVVPAVLETAELLGSAPGIPRSREPVEGLTAPVPGRALALAGGVGLALLGGVALMPRLLYPAAWMALFLLCDPVNALVGWPALLPRLLRGRFRTAVLVALGALVCGFFWEMWNFHASPKWIYHVPFFADGVGYEAPKLFEMPLPGYLGYLPFGLEVFALYHYLAGVVGRPDREFLRIGPPFTSS